MRTLAIIAIAASLASAQPQPRARALFEPGLSQEQMFREFGHPAYMVGAETGTYLSFREYQSMRFHLEAFWPVYKRKTRTNEYEIVVHQIVDESRSHLHPTIRASEIVFKLDKNKSPSEIIKDIPEAAKVCAHKCFFEADGGDLYAIGPVSRSVLEFSGSESQDLTMSTGDISILVISPRPELTESERWEVEEAIDYAKQYCDGDSKSTVITNAQGKIAAISDPIERAKYTRKLHVAIESAGCSPSSEKVPVLEKGSRPQ